MPYTLYVLPTKNKVAEYFSSWKSHHDGDSGIDLINLSTITVLPFGVETINFGFKTKMVNENGETCSYWLIPRSSISKTPFQMANSIGLIDAGYRGEIMAKVRNISQHENSITKDDKLFQICAPDLGKINVVIVDELDETSRGEGGFGSTN
jgi:dUTP pyrophosphatase